MWEISNKLQIIGFLYSIVLGLFYGLFYDILRAVRIIKKPKILTVFFEDIVYFFIISITTFIFFLSITNGEIRVYILLGIILGFLLFLNTLSHFFLKGLTMIFKAVYRVYRCINRTFYWLFEKIGLILTDFLKKGLKNIIGLLYTIRKAVKLRFKV